MSSNNKEIYEGITDTIEIIDMEEMPEGEITQVRRTWRIWSGSECKRGGSAWWPCARRNGGRRYFAVGLC